MSLNADLTNHRQASPLGLTISSVLLRDFGFCWPDTTCLLSQTNTNGIAATDGYWLMLEPLSPGSHQIIFGSTFTDGTNLNITANITAVPMPGAFALMLGPLVLSLLGLRRRS